MSGVDFYQNHLDRVSRSFAYCISRLEGEMKDWVGISYLLCRMLDTVEDAPWKSSESQSKAFDQFKNFMQECPAQLQVSEWANQFPTEIPQGEHLLLRDALKVFQDLHSLPSSVLKKIQNSVLNMYRGMRFFLSKQRENSVLKLKTLTEVNQYCFFVAGLVGELLTDLITEKRPQLNSLNTYLDAHHFGLFLQKINLLKDQSKDEKEGRFLIHSRAEVLASLASNAEGAIRYLQSIPLAEKGFRLFCAWSLFLGLASLPWIEKSRILSMIKIPRLVTERLFQSVEKIIGDNQALLHLFQEMLPKFPEIRLSSESTSIKWMEDLYFGQLGESQFLELGITKT